jgi:hypothetical protein
LNCCQYLEIFSLRKSIYDKKLKKNNVFFLFQTKWLLDNKFPGLMVWEMIADDVEGVCDGITKYPLMKAVLKTIAGY